MLDVENRTPSTSTCLPCRSKSFPKMNIQNGPTLSISTTGVSPSYSSNLHISKFHLMK